MFQRLPRYTEYAPAEGWTEAPAHWRVIPGLAVIDENQRRNDGLREDRVLSLSFGKIVVKPVEKQRGLVPESYEGYQILDPGDIVIRPTDLQNDQTSIRVGQVRDRGIITSAYIGVRSKGDWLTGYAYLFLSVVDSTRRIYGMGTGLRQQLGWSDLKRMPCLVPPANEQAAIVKYLTHANARIDKAIAGKRRLIALLGEARSATVDGLVLGVAADRRSTSLSPWFNGVPAGWELRRAKTLTSFVTSGSRGWADYYADSGPMFLQSGNLGRRLELKLETVQRVDLPESASEGTRTRVKPGDLLVCITGALTGNVALVPELWREEAYVNQHIALVRPRPGVVNAAFLGHALKSAPSQAQFRGSEYGGTTKQGMGLDEVKNVEVLVPPLAAQKAIVGEIAERTAEIDVAIAEANREVHLLGEFRTRLIADVVTGQVDVQEIAASLPGIEPGASGRDAAGDVAAEVEELEGMVGKDGSA